MELIVHEVNQMEINQMLYFKNKIKVKLINIMIKKEFYDQT